VAAMLEADSMVAGRAWGELHRVRATHALGTSAALQRLLRLDVGQVPHRGSPHTVNVAPYEGTTIPFTTSYGASQRHVEDMADVDGSGGFILPTGQSGIPVGRERVG